jgi:hypothetical protein
MHPLTSEKLAKELAICVTTTAALLALNAALARNRAIYRLRSIHDIVLESRNLDSKGIERNTGKILDFFGIELFSGFLKQSVRDFYDLKTLDKKLRENNSPFGITVLPDEQILADTTFEEFEATSEFIIPAYFVV